MTGALRPGDRGVARPGATRDPDVVRWVVTESSFRGGGEGWVASTAAEGGGSRVHAEWTSEGASRQRLLLALLHHGPAHLLLRRWWTSTFEDLAATERA